MLKSVSGSGRRRGGESGRQFVSLSGERVGVVNSVGSSCSAKNITGDVGAVALGVGVG